MRDFSVLARSGKGVVLAATLAGGCGVESPASVQVPIAMHQLAQCPVSESVLRTGFIELTAFGDFDAALSTSAVFGARSSGQILDFPEQTTWLSAALGAEVRGFWSSRAARFGAPVNLLLWPRGSACALGTAQQFATYPARGGGQAFGYSPRQDLVLLAGGDAGESSAVVGALTFSLGLGRVRAVDARARHVLLEPRAFSSATEFGDKLLVAGGEDPLSSAAPEARPVWRSAEVFDPALDRFELELVELRQARTRHAALVLPDGATLLLGGRGSSGEALTTLEIVDPATRTSSLAGLATLERGRSGLTALTTDFGEIAVLGGLGSDQLPLGTLEWLTRDGAEHARASVELPARYDMAFAAMPGGGILAVGGCVAGATSDEVRAPCRHGVPPERWEGFWLAPSGAITAFPLDFAAPSPVLVSGESGAPWLLATGAESPDQPENSLYRFDPWQGHFEAQSITLPGTAFRGAAVRGLAIDPGLFISVSDGPEHAELFGVRHGLRQEFVRDLALVLSVDPDDPRRPWHLVPDRVPQAGGVVYDGELELSEGRVFVSDATFADFRARLRLRAGKPPQFILKNAELGAKIYGGTACPWPGGAAASESVAVVRSGLSVVLERQGLARTCSGPSGRVRVGIEAATMGSTRVSRWDMQRSLASE